MAPAQKEIVTFVKMNFLEGNLLEIKVKICVQKECHFRGNGFFGEKLEIKVNICQCTNPTL